MATTPPPYEPPSPPPPGEPPHGPPAARIPWEQPGQPPLESLFETIKLFVLDPQEAFRRMPVAGDLGRPILYAVIIGWLGVIISQIYSLALRGVMWNFMPGMPGGQELAMGTGATILMMLLAPILVIIGVFLWSAIVHLFLMLLSAADGGFTATVRVVSYSSTAQLAQLIPVCGGFVAMIWSVVLAIIGIATAHRTTTGKAALAVLLPLVLCCVCIAIIAAMFGAAIGAAMSQYR
jgi:hypothetical protein